MLEGYYLKVDDCVLKAWRKANEGDLSALRVYDSVNTLDKTRKHLYDEEKDMLAWEELQNDFLQKIGLSDRFMRFLELLKRKGDLQLKYLNSRVKQKLSDGSYIEIRDRRYLNKIEIVEAKLKQYRMTGGNEITVNKMLIKLSKMQGHFLKETDITVLDYHNLIDEYSSHGKKDN